MTFPAPATDGFSQGLPRAYLRPCLLLLLSEGESHGYELLQQVRDLGLIGADAGGLYRTMRTMERDDLVVSWWEPSQSGPARRTYELTAPGRAALEREIAGLAETHRLLCGLLDRYGQMATQELT
ncbi:hypothetical protein BH20ACT2_BH20ACT2_00790 [soil metagenome]